MDSSTSDKEEFIPTTLKLPEQREESVRLAQDTDMVNGIKASTVIQPNSIIPLDQTGQFPAASVIKAAMVAALWSD